MSKGGTLRHSFIAHGAKWPIMVSDAHVNIRFFINTYRFTKCYYSWVLVTVFGKALGFKVSEKLSVLSCDFVGYSVCSNR